MSPQNRYLFGEWVDSTTPLDKNRVNDICNQADAMRKAMASCPLDRILHLLSRVRDAWADPEYPGRKYCEEKLPSVTGFSSEMIRLGMDHLVLMLDPASLQKKVDIELRQGPSSMDIHHDSSPETLLDWTPLGTLLHVLSGNVFLVAATSLIQGLLSRNVNIIKMSSAETVFLPELVKTIAEYDTQGVISKSIAVVDYGFDHTDVLDEFKSHVDGIVLWGGEEAVWAYRNNLPAKTRFIDFGPKLSIAAVSSRGLEKYGVDSVSENIAREISIWDQNACTAPQVCYIEGKDNAEKLVTQLHAEMEKTESTLPSGDIDFNRACEIRKLRTVFEVEEAAGKGLLRASGTNLSWTILLDHFPRLEPSPLHRTIRIIPVESLCDTVTHIESMRGYIQTVGLAASPDEEAGYARLFCDSGAVRVVPVGQMAEGEAHDPHDGRYDLPLFMNLTQKTLSSRKNIHPADTVPEQERNTLLNARLRKLVSRAVNSDFYSKRLRNINIDTIKDLCKIPILTRAEMESNVPPYGNGLSTGLWSGGYVSRSGGSTGKPKFSIYDCEDWNNMMDHAVKVFRSMGFEQNDRLANCMMAGDLYGSFVSFDHINYRAGLTSFAFAGNANPDMFSDVWKKFNINAIQGVPTVIIPLLKTVKEIEPDFRIQKVMYAGSPMSQTDRDWLIEELGAERISSVIGANDGGQIAYQCEKLTGTLHHTVDDFNYIEIVDDKGKPVPDGEPGRILITSLLKYAFPLIRYDIGDTGRIIPEPCACGRTTRILEYLGRNDDTLTIGLMNLRYRDIVDAIPDIHFSELQVAARNNEFGEFLVFRFETDNPEPEKETESVRTGLLEKIPALEEKIRSGHLLKIEVELFKPGTIKRIERTGKLRNVVDERK